MALWSRGLNMDKLEGIIYDNDASGMKTLLESISKQVGWQSAFLGFKTALMDYFKERWFGINRFILGVFNLDEFLGLDEDLLSILEHIEDGNGFDSVSKEFENQLIALTEKQLKSGGSTLFFDVEKMSTKPSAVLVKLLADQRWKEFRKVLTQFRKKQETWKGMKALDLKPIYSTHYGYKVLKTLGLGLEVQSRDELLTLVDALGKIETTITSGG
jgi:hypothetical protein